jgi:hypothetical protein
MSAHSPSDPFTIYEVGIDQLLDFLGDDHSRVSEVLVFQQHLLENIASAPGQYQRNKVAAQPKPVVYVRMLVRIQTTGHIDH